MDIKIRGRDLSDIIYDLERRIDKLETEVADLQEELDELKPADQTP